MLARDAGLAALTGFCLLPIRPLLRGVRAIPSPRPRPGRYLGRGPRTSGRRVRFWQPELKAERQRLAAYAAELEDRRGGTGENLSAAAHRLSPVGKSPRSGWFTLICRRRRLGHNSWLHGATRDGQTEAVVWLSPFDLERLGLPDGGQVLLETDSASLKLPAVPVADVAQGVVVVPHGLPKANVNALIPTGVERLEPLSGQHGMTGIPVRVTADVGLRN